MENFSENYKEFSSDFAFDISGISVKRYRKKPVVIEAVEYESSDVSVQDSIINWVKINGSMASYDKDKILIETLEGPVTASVGDYIIKGVNGEFYPCKPDIFTKTYYLEGESSTEEKRYDTEVKSTLEEALKILETVRGLVGDLGTNISRSTNYDPWRSQQDEVYNFGPGNG